VTTDTVAEVFPRADRTAAPVAALAPKQFQDRVLSEAATEVAAAGSQVGKSTKTAEATAPTGGAAVPVPAK